MKKCSSCLKQIANNAKQCKYCGETFGKKDKSKVVTSLIEKDDNYIFMNRWDKLACFGLDFLLTLTIIGGIINLVFIWISNRTLSFKLFKIGIESDNSLKMAIGIRFLLYFPTVFFFIYVILLCIDNLPHILDNVFTFIVLTLIAVNFIELFQKGPSFIDKLLGVHTYSEGKPKSQAKNKNNGVCCPICGNIKDKISPLCDGCIDTFYELNIDSMQKNPKFDINHFVEIQNKLTLSRGKGKSFDSCVACNGNIIGNGKFLCSDCTKTFMSMYVEFSNMNGRLGKTSKEVFKNALCMTKGKADLINLVHENFES